MLGYGVVIARPEEVSGPKRMLTVCPLITARELVDRCRNFKRLHKLGIIR